MGAETKDGVPIFHVGDLKSQRSRTWVAKGKQVNRVLIAQDVYEPGDSEPREFYMSVLLDRSQPSLRATPLLHRAA